VLVIVVGKQWAAECRGGTISAEDRLHLYRPRTRRGSKSVLLACRPKLYSYRARWYDPQAGRFLCEDPLSFTAGDTNLYRYVFNNPTTLTDPTGEIVPVIVGTLVVFGGVGLLEWASCRYKYATDYYLGKPLSEWSPELQEELRRYVRQTDWIAACGEVAGYTGVTMVGSPYLGKMIADTWAYNGACHELGKLLVISMASFGSCEVIGEGIDIYRQWDLLTPPDRFRRVGDLGGPLFAGGLCGGWGGGQVRPSPSPIPPLLSPLLP
jgi:hypothetical protein